MENIGIIDIGSNSIRLVIVKIHDNGYFKIIDEIKETIRLGKDMTPEGRLDPARIDSAIEALGFFKTICEAKGVNKIIAAATAAVRRASNQAEFLKRAREELKIDIRVLSGTEEAYYDYFGTVNSMYISECIIMDIGGGSTELIWVKDGGIKESISLPFGSITITDMFNINESLDIQKERNLNDFLLKAFNSTVWLKNVRGLPLTGIGGTIRNIGKIDAKNKNYPIDFIHNYKMTSGDVTGIYRSIKTMGLKDRKKLNGLSKDRADIFPGAVSIISFFIQFCQVPEVYISGSGVREGLIYDYILKSKTPIKNILDFSLNNLLESHGLNRKQSSYVWKLSQSLYDGLKDIHGIRTDVSKILKTASMLYNLGVDISFYDNYRHSFYMILNSGIYGLTHREMLMAAYVAALHRKSGYRIDSYHYRALLNEEDVSIISRLGVILKIAANLGRRMNENIEDLQCVELEDTVVIKVISKSSPALEIGGAMEAAQTFAKIFKKKLIIV